jgi:hypothetical protein
MRVFEILVGAIVGLVVCLIVAFGIAMLFLAFGSDDNPYTESGDAGAAMLVLALAVVIGPVVGGYVAARLTREAQDGTEGSSKSLW